jgi:hypothetical protein
MHELTLLHVIGFTAYPFVLLMVPIIWIREATVAMREADRLGAVITGEPSGWRRRQGRGTRPLDPCHTNANPTAGTMTDSWSVQGFLMGFRSRYALAG